MHKNMCILTIKNKIRASYLWIFFNFFIICKSILILIIIYSGVKLGYANLYASWTINIVVIMLLCSNKRKRMHMWIYFFHLCMCASGRYKEKHASRYGSVQDNNVHQWDNNVQVSVGWISIFMSLSQSLWSAVLG